MPYDTEANSRALGRPIDLAAEQAVIGAVLYENECADLLEGLAAEQFAEPFHARLFEAAIAAISGGRLAEVVGMAKRFEADPGFEGLGGLQYLADLVDRAPGKATVAHFGKMVAEAAQRRALLDLAETVSGSARAQDETPTDTIGRAEAALLAMQVSSRTLELVHAGDAAGRVLDKLDAPPEAVFGIKTGLEPLDELLGPVQPGELVLLQGRPSMGKSAAAECIAFNIAQQGHGVIQINGEMSVEDMAQRHLADICQHKHGFAGPEYRDIRRRRIEVTQRRMLGEAHQILGDVPLMMLKRPGLRLSQLRSLCRRQAALWARQGVKLEALIVDHVGLLRTDNAERDRYAAQTMVSNAMKELADELGCVIFGLNQMNRESEKRDDKRPQLSDLRDSGSWEQDADFVIGWYREAYYAQRQAEPKKDLEWSEWDRARKSRTVEAIVLKARAGECKTVNLWGDVARNAIRGLPPEGELL